jgi:hypothetical protein
MANTKTYAALKNDKHEKFCNFTSAGMSAADAYIAAGYVVGSRDAARAAASKLNRVPSVASRLAELQPAIDARLEESAKEIAQVVEDEVLTSMGRVITLAIRRRKMLDVIDARAKHPDHQWAPGGSTGMVITGEKAVGKKIIKTHEFDATISRELRETEKQIAIELKQWSEKVKHKFDPMEWLRTASVEELRAALPALRAAREKLGLPTPPKLKPN